MRRFLIRPAQFLPTMALTLALLAPLAQAQGTGEGLRATHISHIDAAFNGQIEKGVYPGAVVLIARDGGIAHLKAYGHLDGTRQKPMPVDAVFRIASMTKPLVTTAAMVLVERGQLGLHESLASYFPEFKDMRVETRSRDAEGKVIFDTEPARRPILIHDLLRHTSGFTYSFTGPASDPIRKAYIEQDIEQQKGFISKEEMIKRLAAIPLTRQPGTEFDYGLSVDVLGFVIEKITGKRLDAAVTELVLTPLGMRDTGFLFRDTQRARIAEALDSDPLKKWLWSWLRIDDADKGYLVGGGGMVSTAADYFRFAQMIADGGVIDGKRLLARQTVDMMLTDQLVGLGRGNVESITGPGYSFGLGFAIRISGTAFSAGSLGDANWAGVTGPNFTIDRQERLVAILMAQGPAGRFANRFLLKNLVYGALDE